MLIPIAGAGGISAHGPGKLAVSLHTNTDIQGKAFENQLRVPLALVKGRRGEGWMAGRGWAAWSSSRWTEVSRTRRTLPLNPSQP